ncbi:MAG: FAD-dependent oxidoreductase [Pirellulaceae bacterium]|nr:FAD-dependent oxidoreductase [Pirellulaceae bacterium]
MRKPSLAIIGSGISGLSAGFFLHRHFDVTLFEADDRIGGHTNTRYVDLECLKLLPRYNEELAKRVSDGSVLPVDTGFIVFNDRTYPNMIRLFADLGVASQATEMSFSVRCDKTGIEYSGSTLNSYFAQRRNLLRPSFYRFLFDFKRFAKQAVECLETEGETQTVGQFFKQNRYSDAFYQRYFLPMGSAIWSCPQGVFESFPIRFICQFYHHHGLLTIRNRPRWRVVCGGSMQYIEPLTRGFAERIHTGSPVVSVRQKEAAGAKDAARWEVEVQPRQSDGTRSNVRHAFDHVVLACHSDQALRILQPKAGSALETTLQAFPYQSNQATLHTDVSALPRNRRAWAAWNYHLPISDRKKTPTSDSVDHATVTYNMNLLQGYTDKQTRGKTFCVTLNGDAGIDPQQVIEKIPYAHPIFSLERLSAQQSHDQWIDANGLSLCGAYWGNGFHEDGLNSALKVSQKLLGMDPWKAVCTADGSSTVGSNR